MQASVDAPAALWRESVLHCRWCQITLVFPCSWVSISPFLFWSITSENGHGDSQNSKIKLSLKVFFFVFFLPCLNPANVPIYWLWRELVPHNLWLLATTALTTDLSGPMRWPRYSLLSPIKNCQGNYFGSGLQHLLLVHFVTGMELWYVFIHLPARLA